MAPGRAPLRSLTARPCGWSWSVDTLLWQGLAPLSGRRSDTGTEQGQPAREAITPLESENDVPLQAEPDRALLRCVDGALLRLSALRDPVQPSDHWPGVEAVPMWLLLPARGLGPLRGGGA